MVQNLLAFLYTFFFSPPQVLSNGRCSVLLYTNEDPLLIRNHFQVLDNPKGLRLRWRPEMANDWMWSQRKVPVNGTMGEQPEEIYVARQPNPKPDGDDDGQGGKRYGIAYRPKVQS